MRRKLAAGIVAVCAVAGIAYYAINRVQGTESDQPAATVPQTGTRPRVEIAHPTPGGLQRVTTQPGSVHAFNAASLYAKVSGYLKDQYVDIGDHVKSGQLLAVIDVPELVKEAQRRAAELKDAQAQVAQMKSRIATAEAAAAVAQANIQQAEADVLRTKAALVFAQKQYDRVKYLFQLKSVDERLVDEKLESLGTCASRRAHVRGRRGHGQSRACFGARPKSTRPKPTWMKRPRKLTSIALTWSGPKCSSGTRRSSRPTTAWSRSANSILATLFWPPTRAAPSRCCGSPRPAWCGSLCKCPTTTCRLPGRASAAVVHIDALPGRTFEAHVSRTADTEDPLTPHHAARRLICPIRTTCSRKACTAMSRSCCTKNRRARSRSHRLPSWASVEAGQAWVYVVRDARLHRTPVQIGFDNGRRLRF